MGRREVLATLLEPLRFPQILLTAFVLEIGAPTTLRWTLGSELWSTGINEVSFYYGHTAKPSKVGDGTDSRELAVAFYRIELVALPDDDD